MYEDESLSAAEIAELTGGELAGDGGTRIAGVSSLDMASPGKAAFLGNPRFKDQAVKSRAGVLLVKERLNADIPQVIVPDPYAAFVKLMEHFHPAERYPAGVHPSAVVDETARLGEGVHVGARAVIEAGVSVGARSAVAAGSFIGRGSAIGEDTVIHPNVTVYPRAKVGRQVVIHSGTVIGADGFGFIAGPDGHVKKPQVGAVRIEDKVEIGANCAIDRAMLDETVIGEGTKLDNLVHLAHNVRVGRHCIILANTASGGSVTIGDNTVISGSCTLKDNITIGSKVMVAGGSGVADDVADGEVVFGYPAMPFSHAKRVYSRLKDLPALFKRVRKLERKGGDD